MHSPLNIGGHMLYCLEQCNLWLYGCVWEYLALHKNKIAIMEFDLKGLKNALVIIFIQIMNFWIV